MSYNKKQNEVLDHWIEYPGAITKKAHLEMFLEEFNAVDPTPDPDLYVILYTDPTGDERISLECELSGHSKKEVEAKLIKIFSDYPNLVVEYVRGDYIIADKDQLWKIVKL